MRQRGYIADILIVKSELICTLVRESYHSYLKITTMPNHLSTLGIIHTAISIIALLVAFNALYRDGKLDPSNGRGRLYIWLTIITCVTGFPIMKTGHLTPGHYLA